MESEQKFEKVGYSAIQDPRLQIATVPPLEKVAEVWLGQLIYRMEKASLLEQC